MRSLKKTTIVCLTAICLLCASVGAFGAAKVSAASFDAADACFFASVGGELRNVEYTRTPLYDLGLAQNGWQYDFNAEGEHGYALIALITVKDDTLYETEEIKLSAASPFDECAGTPVYITHNRYFDRRGGTLYDLGTGAPVDESDAAACAGRGFAYGEFVATIPKTETINYARKEVTENYSIKYDLPPYMGSFSTANCAATAGATAIGYYDRFSENLIPNYKTYTKIGPKFQYKSGDATITELIKTLMTDMGTGVNGAGTTFSGFQKGMQAYVNRMGYTYGTEDMLSYFGFDFDKYKASIDAGKPVCLFLTQYAILNEIVSSNGRDVITSAYCDIAHVMTACGYRVETYYNSLGGFIDKRTYLKVNVGIDFGVDTIGYLNINMLTTMNHAISVTIS